MNRNEVYAAIDEERSFQQTKWGDRPREVGVYLLLIEQHLLEARTNYVGTAQDDLALDSLRKVIALGVACAEQHGLPLRSHS